MPLSILGDASTTSILPSPSDFRGGLFNFAQSTRRHRGRPACPGSPARFENAMKQITMMQPRWATPLRTLTKWVPSSIDEIARFSRAFLYHHIFTVPKAHKNHE